MNLKISLFSLLLISLFLFVSCEDVTPNEPEEEGPINLSGEWTGDNYECPLGITLQVAQITIAHDLETGSVVAVKLTGDDCVPGGDTTFVGTYMGEPSTSFSVDFNMGTPDNPSCCTEFSSIRVVNSTTMEDLFVFPFLEFTKN